ncbi:hypothetical protein ACFQ1S_16205 [Kibdelosporangium lantanae]|uniref:Uncharacterized protein n=1 Tax=Kibdelosporangium lantanae TaxID=1497396 RepID=A0ABW3MAF9_9PSEU
MSYTTDEMMTVAAARALHDGVHQVDRRQVTAAEQADGLGGGQVGEFEHWPVPLVSTRQRYPRGRPGGHGQLT